MASRIQIIGISMWQSSRASLPNRLPVERLLVLILCLLAACTPADQIATTAIYEPTMTEEAFFEQVQELVNGRPWLPDEVAEITKVELKAEADQPNPFFKIFSGKGKDVLAKVELRVSPDGSRGLLILDVSDQLQINQSAVRSRFGESPRFEPASPRQPANALDYIVYHHDWGTVGFGFSRGPRALLKSVTIDATAE